MIQTYFSRKAQCLRESTVPKMDKLALGLPAPPAPALNADKRKTKVFTADEQCAFDNGPDFKAVADQDVREAYSIWASSQMLWREKKRTVST